MGEQNYSNHRRYVPLYHGLTFAIIVLLLVSSIYYTIAEIVNHSSLKPGLFLFLISIAFLSLFYYARSFAERGVRLIGGCRASGQRGQRSPFGRSCVGRRFRSRRRPPAPRSGWLPPARGLPWSGWRWLLSTRSRVELTRPSGEGSCQRRDREAANFKLSLV